MMRTKHTSRHLAVAVLVLLTGAVLTFFEVRVGAMVQVVSRWQPDIEGATHCTQFQSARIQEYLADTLHAGPDTPWATLFLRINRHYVHELIFTLLLAMPAAALLAFGSFVLAAVGDAMRATRGLRWRSLLGMFSDLCDNVPYILWSFPLVFVAWWWYHHPDWGQWLPYGLYLGLIFLGFGSFLLTFFCRQHHQLLLANQARLEAGRAEGSAEWRLLWRFFKLGGARGLFLHQTLYAIAFVLLMDYSFHDILQVHRPSQTVTVFARGHLHYEMARSADAPYLATLRGLKSHHVETSSVAEAASSLLSSRFQMLDPDRRQRLCEAVWDAPFSGYEGPRELVMPDHEQNSVFFREISRFYVGMTCTLIGILFMWHLVRLVERELSYGG